MTTSCRRDVLVEPAVGGRHALDLVDDVLPAGDLAEHAVAPALRARPLVVEKVVVGDVDEELRGRRMRVGRARHRDRVALVLEAVAGFVGDRRARRLLLHPGRHAAALDHEAVDHAVEDRVVVVAVAHVLQEIGDGRGRVLGVELERDVAVVGVQDDHERAFLFARRRRPPC